ncbi:MAG: hypothetical protein FWC19_10700 [Treponema sp.]|nr:hypothetical protein [Treponema sp.]
MRFLKAGIVLLIILFNSCDLNKTAVIWTDSPEAALYGEFFNTAQSQYKVSVRYIEFPGAALLANGGKTNIPDAVIARWLKNSTMNTAFRSLNDLFGTNKLSRNNFYPRLLSLGRIDKHQYLLPVSFNIPALIFSKNSENDFSWFNLSNQFTIDFNEIKNLSSKYNSQSRGAYTRMGFSPLWNDNFLFITAVLNGAAFREASPLAWDSIALERSMIFVNNWTKEINTNFYADDEFTYKYFIEPPEKLIQSGRILFSYMDSNALFALSEEGKNNLDFRWLMEQNRIPIAEDYVYLGIPKKAKSRKAAGAFIQWFLKIESQRQLLEFSQNYRLNDNFFGICGGFSSLTQVTEQVYPLFYPELLGRMPPPDNFTLPNIMPGSWGVLKERVMLPYLRERARKESTEEIYPLDSRLNDWIRQNR